MSFSEFQTKVDNGDVQTAKFLLGDGVIEGELSDGSPYRVAYVVGTEETLTKSLQDNGVEVSADPQKGSALVGFLFQLIPVILIVGAFIFIMNQSQGGGGRVMQFGKARAKLVTKDQPKTTFADVAGVEEAIEELQEVKEYLANPSKFQAMGAKIPRGVLLFGPPGSGKTLLARAVAGEAGVPFYSISGSDFVEMFVGVGAARCGTCSSRPSRTRRHRVHRRDRRRRAPPRRRPGRRPRRTRADAQPAAGGDGRVRPAHSGDPDGRDQPARHPGPGAAAARPFRPAHHRRPPRPRGP
jgi:hypothetical protein